MNGPKIITDGLVLSLDAGNIKSYPTSGNTWFDLSGNGNNCVFNNSPTWSNGIFSFNGTSNFGTITNNSTLDFSSEQTILIVMRHTFTTGRRNPWDQAYGGYGTWTHEQGGNINYFYGDSGTNSTPYVGRNSGTTVSGVWNFMCSTRNTIQSKWYNGITNTETFVHPYGVLTTTTANIRIGLGYAGYWEGDMGMILTYTRELSPIEIIQNYNAISSRFGV